MNYSIFFSPTGGTKKVVGHIGSHFLHTTELDISMDISGYDMTKEDFCIVGVPSFGGRVPRVAAERLRQLQGNQTPALLVVTYGNRAYEDTLKELKDILERQGFACIGAMTVITEHSIVPQIGAGRPTKEDYEDIDAFLMKIKKRLQEEHPAIEVPGNTPYKEYRVVPMQIQVSEQCTACGLCAGRCPVHAIPADAPQTTECEACISCMRCVRICPVQARKCDAAQIEMITDKLQKICPADKKNEFF